MVRGLGLLAAFGHIGPGAADSAASIGYAPSMFQWEVGFADLALGVLGVASFWFRDRWLTAGVVALAISYGGDAIGHIMQYVAHDNTAPNNVWAIPSDIAQPLLGIILLLLYRRGLGKLPTGYRRRGAWSRRSRGVAGAAEPRGSRRRQRAPRSSCLGSGRHSALKTAHSRMAYIIV